MPARLAENAQLHLSCRIWSSRQIMIVQIWTGGTSGMRANESATLSCTDLRSDNMISNPGSRRILNSLALRTWDVSCFIGLCAFGFLAASTVAAQWKGLTPLHSSRQDVQRILGSAAHSGKFISSYELEGEI